MKTVILRLICSLLIVTVCLAGSPASLGSARSVESDNSPVKQQEASEASHQAIPSASLFNIRKPREIRRTIIRLRRAPRQASSNACAIRAFVLFQSIPQLRGPPSFINL
jgi:hypothetical protein